MVRQAILPLRRPSRRPAEGSAGTIPSPAGGARSVERSHGAVWITHLKAKDEGNGAGIKLPAASALGVHAAKLPHSVLPIDAEALPRTSFRAASLGYRTFREIHYVEQ